ncbi:MAG: MarR family transcriptional regulator [Pseudomonadota bacterium]
MVNNKLDDNLLFCFERTFHAFKTILWNETKKANISPIQQHILLYLKNNKKEDCFNAKIAIYFGLTKPTLTETLNSLESKKYIKKQAYSTDKRKTNIQITAKGKKLLAKFNSWNNTLEDILKKLTFTEKDNGLNFLYKLIIELQNKKIISESNICLTCHNFIFNKFAKSTKPHYCNFTKIRISNSEIRYNCEEHT